MDRRELLKGCSVFAISLASQWGAEAQVFSGAPCSTNPARRSNLNLNFDPANKEQRYINIAKSGSRVNDPSHVDFYLNLNADSYPSTSGGSLSAGSYNLTFTAYAPADNPGPTTFVAKWQGYGSIQISSWTPLTNSSRTTANYRGGGSVSWNGGGAGSGTGGAVVQNGRVTFSVPWSQLSSGVTITSGTSGQTPSISDLVICRADEEDAYDAGQTFRTRFLNQIAAYNPGAIRFMDSQNIVQSLLANWGSQPTTTSVTYCTGPYVANNKVGQLSYSAEAYSCAAYPGMPVTYQHGEFIHASVGTTNTTTAPTLDVGSRGAKPILNYDTSALSIGGLNTASPRTLVYNQYYDSWLTVLLGLNTGHPISMEVALCNAANVPGWINIPTMATDDFVTQLANYLAANYQPNVVYIEYCNEVFNGGLNTGNATQAGLADSNIAPYIGGSPTRAYSAWYGQRVKQIAAIMRPILGSKLKMVLASTTQSDTAGVTYEVSIRWDVTGIPSLSGANSPILSADIVAIAMYYAGSNLVGFGPSITDSQWTNIPDPASVKTNVDNWNTGTPALVTNSLNWALNDIKGQTYLRVAPISNPAFRATVSDGIGGIGNILNVSAISAGSLAIGEYLAGTGIDSGTKIIPGGTGTGGVGTYLINNSYNLSSRAMTGTAWSRFFNFNNAAATYGKKVALYECNIEVGAPTIVGASSLPGFNNVPNFTVDANNTLFPNGAQTYSQNTLIPTSVGAILVVYAASSSGPNVYVKLGTSSSVTATTSDILVSSNGWTAIAVGANTWVAVIAATGSSSVVLAGGNTNFVGGETGTKNGFFAAPSYFLQPYCGVTSTNNPIPKGAKLVVCNPGAVAAYIKLGTTNAVTATTSGGGYDYTVAANGGWTVFDVGSNEYVASICASGSTTLILMGGTGTVAAGTTGTNPYGGPSGLIAQFYRAFFASAQFQQLTEWHSSWFYSYSQSYMASIYAMATPDPWLTFPQINPAAYDAGDTILTPYKNWDAHVRYNTGLVC